jgi:hypothetical protein
VEYRNTIRDLLGVDYNTSEEFPADDSGYGFDNVGAALSVSPLLVEKYLNAAEEIVAQALERERGKSKPSPSPSLQGRANSIPSSAALQGRENTGSLRLLKGTENLTNPKQRDAYAREVLSKFVKRAYRRPVDDVTVDRLTELAKSVYAQPGQTIEAGGAFVAAVFVSRGGSGGRRTAVCQVGRICDCLAVVVLSLVDDAR